MEDNAAYIAEITKKYRAAVRRIAALLAQNFASTLPEASYQEVVDKVIFTTFRNWNTEFIAKVAPITTRWTRALYKKYRKDTSIFGALAKPPQVSFSLSDFRAMDYFKTSDRFFLGRFITDESTVKKVTAYIKKEYLEQGGEIGRSAKMLDKFKENFAGVLDGEDWKIRRVIDTTTSRMRTTGALHYMVQAEVEEFEIIEAMDRLTCDYCSEMNGRRFGVQRIYEKVHNLDFGDGSQIAEKFPFAGSVYKNASDMAGLSSSELASAGVDMPPYHPACRGTVVAVL